MSLLKPSRIPSFLKWWYPSWYVWNQKKKAKTVYLTFDDGPIPEVTEFVLDTLSRKRDTPIPATFFCIGDNVRKHPNIFKRIITEGHVVGNHTYNHLKGTVIDTKTYLKNIQLANLEMSKHLATDPKTLSTVLFRPPYGRIKKKQALALKKLGYTITMYRIVAYDWELSVTPQECLQNIIKVIKNGDIIVLHDSLKAFENMKYALPRAIDYLEKEGFIFDVL